MSSSAYIAVFGAIFLPAVIYLTVAVRERKNITDIRDFFPLKRSISTGEYRSTTIAAGMSLATVIIALINLAPILGATLFVSVLSYSASFLILYPCVDRIMSANSQNDSIQTFLGKTYQSEAVKYVALTFSLIGYVSIFSMELLVGVTVLQPFLGEKIYIFALLYLVFLIIYSMLSGYRAIVATDRWQLRFILLGLLSLIILAFIQTGSAPDVRITTVFSKIFSSWLPVWPFILGITFMNLPAPLSDAGTWQRLCSTKDAATAKRGLLQIAPFFAILWSILILFGCYFSDISIAQGFDPQKGTLLAYVMTTLGGSNPLMNILLFFFVLGLFSAMISTADSLLIVASQLFTIDIMKVSVSGKNNDSNLKKARITMLAIAVISFLIFSIFQWIQFDVVQLVFAIYGAQLAMFPAVCLALFRPKGIDIRGAKTAVILSIMCGFIGGWGSALYGKFSGGLNWLYNAPVTALTSAGIVFLVFYLPVLIKRNAFER